MTCTETSKNSFEDSDGDHSEQFGIVQDQLPAALAYGKDGRALPQFVGSVIRHRLGGLPPYVDANILSQFENDRIMAQYKNEELLDQLQIDTTFQDMLDEQEKNDEHQA